jgi:AcrR family transcriptional regulator
MATTTDGTGTARGAATRARILAATAGILSATDGGGAHRAVTVSEIARAAGVYPNQITHHYGSKDRLVLDAAFALFLRDTTRLQAAGRRATNAESFRQVLARTALAMPSTPLVVRALAAAGDDVAQRERVRLLLAVLFRRRSDRRSVRPRPRGDGLDQRVRVTPRSRTGRARRASRRRPARPAPTPRS